MHQTFRGQRYASLRASVAPAVTRREASPDASARKERSPDRSAGSLTPPDNRTAKHQGQVSEACPLHVNFGKIRFQEEDIFLAVFSYFTDAASGNFFLAFFPASVMMVAGHSARVSVTLV